MSSTAGYIVEWADNQPRRSLIGPMKICPQREEPDGILLFSNTVTLFPSRASAKEAIKRTLHLAQVLRNPWSNGEFIVRRVVGAPGGGKDAPATGGEAK